MSDKIAIQYDAVYAKCAQLCANLDAAMANMDSKYALIRNDIQGMDSRANAVLSEAMIKNRNKAQMTCDVLKHLLGFMEKSSKQVEEDEKILKASYTLGQSTGGAL